MINGEDLLAKELLNEVTLLSIRIVSSAKLNMVVHSVGTTDDGSPCRSETAHR